MSSIYFFTLLKFKKNGRTIKISFCIKWSFRENGNNLLINFPLLHYTSWVTCVSNSWTELPDFKIYWDTDALCSAQVLHYTAPGGADHIDRVEKCIPSMQCTVQPHAAAPLGRLQYFPDEHALPFNKYLLSICYVQDTLLGSGEYKKDMLPFTWSLPSGREAERDRKWTKCKYIYTLSLVISARENSKARWWGDGIPAIGEFLFEKRWAESLHCWHFWSEGNERTNFHIAEARIF